MKSKTFILRDEKVIAHLIAFINAQPKEPIIEVVVREHKKKRSLLQNSLYWLWVTIISNDLGMTKEDEHFDLRKRMLAPIYERDDLQYSEALKALRDLYSRGFKKEANNLFDQITSTTTANVKQFAEYLTEIERDMMGKGIVLPHPEDLYYDSLMIKRNS